MSRTRLGLFQPAAGKCSATKPVEKQARTSNYWQGKQPFGIPTFIVVALRNICYEHYTDCAHLIKVSWVCWLKENNTSKP